MLRRFSINFALFSMLLDGVSVIFCLWMAKSLRPFLNRVSFIKDIGVGEVVPETLYFILPVIWVIIFSALSIYDGRKFLRAADEVSALFLSTIIASVSSAGILYFSFRDVSRALFILFVILTFLICLFWRGIIRAYFRLGRQDLDVTLKALVVGAGPLGRNVGEQIGLTGVGTVSLVGYVDDGLIEEKVVQTLGNIERLPELVMEHSVTDVVLALPYSQYLKMAEIVSRIEKLPVGVWVALGFFDLALYRTEIEDMAGIPMLDLRASAINDYQRMLKRTFDIAFAILALIPALPLMLLSALLVIVDDGFPILFQQQRVGENGRLFGMLKFRTMVRDAEKVKGQVESRDADGNIIHKKKDDPRVTRVGRFLRRFSLDELPQLFNILNGSMSVVGPRPELPYLVEKYQPWQRKRFAVPPGLTGWWQVNGRSDKPMHLHTEDDLYYIQNYSIWLDLQIIVRTIWVVIIGRGSY